MKIFLFVFLFFGLYSINSPYNTPYSQTFNFNQRVNSGLPYVCDNIPLQFINNFRLYNGRIKPERTDMPGVPPDAYFPVLIIFVQFKNDIGPESEIWPKNKPPVYYKQTISNIKKYPVNGNWWDTYSETDEILSDYWLEQSRGSFHIAGRAYSVILDHEYSYYMDKGGIYKVNDDIYAKLKTFNINWREFDKWSASSDSAGSYNYSPDGFVDMIYKVHRSRVPSIGMPSGGIALLFNSYSQGENYIIDSAHGIKINGSYGLTGSGVFLTPGSSGNEDDSTYTPNAPMSLWGTISFSEHEFGHYIFGAGHGNYGKMCGDGAPYGADECLSPFEAAYLGYSKPYITNYTTYEYLLSDFSSRNSNENGEILQVPVSGNSEFFLIANRRKVSHYDRIMWGDTAKSEPYRDINPEYGKGVYIYHVSGGFNYPSIVDEECADGLYNWSFEGYQHPDWSDQQQVDYFKRNDVSYQNDNSLGGSTHVDGKSMNSWFGLGKKHESLYSDGTDKVFTTKNEVWTSRELLGDRWDAWNTGYNEIFSPYSSPSTKTWNDGTSGIFIWYDSLYSDGRAHFKIYRPGIGGLTEDEILSLTPPSKPMALTIRFTECMNNYIYPRLNWVNNLEPDMKSPPTSPNYELKAYKIFRAVSDNETSLPVDYKYIKTTYIHDDAHPEFIDYDIELPCSLSKNTMNVRYKISAVDMYFSESVKSDFAGFSLAEQNLNVDNYNEKGNPFKYSLSQNYPNPFNPVTNINYSLARDGEVNIKVYNILGEEVLELVNQNMKTGEYTVHFNAANLPSGIYLYRIQTAFFTESKKMVLIK